MWGARTENTADAMPLSLRGSPPPPPGNAKPWPVPGPSHVLGQGLSIGAGGGRGVTRTQSAHALQTPYARPFPPVLSSPDPPLRSLTKAHPVPTPPPRPRPTSARGPGPVSLQMAMSLKDILGPKLFLPPLGTMDVGESWIPSDGASVFSPMALRNKVPSAGVVRSVGPPDGGGGGLRMGGSPPPQGLALIFRQGGGASPGPLPPSPGPPPPLPPSQWPADMQSRRDSHRAPPRRPVSLKIGPQIKSNQIPPPLPPPAQASRCPPPRTALGGVCPAPRPRGAGVSAAHLRLTSPMRGTPCVPKTLFGSGRQAQSPKPRPKGPSSDKTKITIGKIWSGHFWYTNFWVPDPPPPFLLLPFGGGGVCAGECSRALWFDLHCDACLAAAMPPLWTLQGRGVLVIVPAVQN